MTYNKLNNILGWVCFLIASFVYISTLEPTVSLWDCGEYIATAYKLEVGHPPGAPLFQMLGRFFSLFAMGDVTQVAYMINLMSGLCSALTILFLFWTITALGLKIAKDKEGVISEGKKWIVFGSGLVGALAYTFTDSFWFSAVEGEVYAMSSFFTAVTFWAMLKWERVADQEGADRWIIFIAYLIGLSIGVHLLNLLAVPALVFIYYYKKYKNFSPKGIAMVGGLSIILLGGIQNLIIPGVVNLAANFELFFVNTVHLPYNSGTIIYFFLMVALLVTGIIYTHKQTANLFSYILVLGGLFFLISLLSSGKASDAFLRIIIGGAFFGLLFYMKNKGRFAHLNTILLSFVVLIIGYSSFFMLVIRSQANTPIDENNPENAVNLLAYLNREQYGSSPLAYGQYYNAPPSTKKPFKDGNPVYIRKDVATQKDNTVINQSVDGGPAYAAKANRKKVRDEYVISDDRKASIPVYDERFCTLFPRMWSAQSNHKRKYQEWSGMLDETGELTGGKPVTITNRNGEQETLIRPTFFENLRYFRRYQINWMYFRYFFWNYVGRQNDIQGHGGAMHGNWHSGIPFIDSAIHGPEENLPDALDRNKGKNSFYALPLILGLIGLFFHIKSAKRDAFVVFLLFFFTGIAIVVYLNQYPYQPRERDYAFAASFYAFAVWIGLGVFGIAHALRNVLGEKPRALLATALCTLAVPTIMAKEGWDDHDRSGRSPARDFAINYLESCAPNAILFTNGDNDTFPLWYAQEVEGIRTDVRVVNLSLLNTDWYIDQMRRAAYDSEPVPFSLTNAKYRQGTRDYVIINEDPRLKGKHIPVKLAVDFVASDRKEDKVMMSSGEPMNYLPTKSLSIPVDSAYVVNNGTVLAKNASRIRPVTWRLNKGMLYKNDLMVLDLLAYNNWKRPVYFAVTTGPDAYMGLEDYFRLEGLTYRLTPVENTPQEKQVGARVATDVMYDNIMNKFRWGKLNKPGTYVDENVLRMGMNLRIQMGALASALAEEGRKDKAEEVLDKCLEVLPNENVPYDATIFSLILAYYQADATDKAIELSRTLYAIFENDFKYYSSNGIDTREFRQAQEMLNRLAYLANEFKQADLFKEFSEKNIQLGLRPPGQPG